MIHKLYVILTISLICSNSVFSQEPTKKIAFDLYISPTLSQTINNFIPTTYYKNRTPYFTTEIKQKPNFILSNYGFTLNFENPKRLTFGIGLALLKRGGRKEYKLIPTSGNSKFFIDSSSTPKESNTNWYYNCLDFPITIEFLHSQTSKWTKSIKASISISYVINYKTKMEGVFFNDSTFTNKAKWEINPPFKDRLGFSFECGYRFKSVFINKTYFWFEPYINCLISSTREIMPAGYLNVGIHLGIQIY